jgi:hypothetical protein
LTLFLWVLDDRFSKARIATEGAVTNTSGIVRGDQSRAIDLSSRNAHELESVHPSITGDVLAKLTPIFE